MGVNASDLRETITLQRLNHTTMVWADFAQTPTVRAAVEPQGEERYRLRLRYRADLRGKADLAPAVRVLWGDLTLVVDDVAEFDWHREVHLTAHQVLVATEHLETGARRVQAWP